MWNWRPLLCLFAVTIALSLPTTRGKRTTEQAALAAFEVELERATAADTFSGTVVVARHGTPIFERAYNRADRDRAVQNTLDTSFNTASITKMYTAVVALRLVQDGKLALTDTVGKWIPDYPDREIREHVTIHHLLTHTGGAGDIFDEDYLDYRLTLQTHDDYVKKFGARAPQFAAGARWEYANYGFVLVGVIIERVTGMTYYEAVAKYVFAPAGMQHSSFPRYDEDVGAIGYTRLRGRIEANNFILLYRGVAAGSAWSSTRDLLAFANAVQARKLLDDTHTKLFLTPQVRTRHGFRYGYGIGETTIDGVHCMGHNGGFPGANGELMICDNGYTIATLANFDPPAASKMAAYIARRLPAN